MSTAPPETSLPDAIADGELDDCLDALAAAIEARRRLPYTVDSSRALARLCPGDRVRITGAVTPRDLAGLDSTVIELDDPRDHPSRATDRAVPERAPAMPSAPAGEIS
jgi:hypothetical protein